MKRYETKEAAEQAADHYQFLYESCQNRYKEKELEQYFHSTLRGNFTCFVSIIATIVIVTDIDFAIWQSACTLVLIPIPVFFCYYVFGVVFDGFHWTRKQFWKWLILFFLIATIALCLLSH